MFFYFLIQDSNQKWKSCSYSRRFLLHCCAYCHLVYSALTHVQRELFKPTSALLRLQLVGNVLLVRIIQQPGRPVATPVLLAVIARMLRQPAISYVRPEHINPPPVRVRLQLVRSVLLVRIIQQPGQPVATPVLSAAIVRILRQLAISHVQREHINPPPVLSPLQLVRNVLLVRIIQQQGQPVATPVLLAVIARILQQPAISHARREHINPPPVRVRLQLVQSVLLVRIIQQPGQPVATPALSAAIVRMLRQPAISHVQREHINPTLVLSPLQLV